MKDIEQIKSKRLLLVEGNDEKWFCIQLLQSLGINQDSENLEIQVIDIVGRVKSENGLTSGIFIMPDNKSAGQPVIVNTLANAAKKNLWDFTNPVFCNIIGFIKELIH